VGRLSGLFAVDSFAGGITVSAFIAYWLTTRFDASANTVALTFAALGLPQTASFLLAPLIADRIGLLATMVFTHLASDAFLVAVAFAPTLPIAIGLLLARTSLSQMDVPTRQAYVMALVDPAERTAAAAYTGTVRYLTRPFGPPLAGLTLALNVGLPFVLSGTLKAGYDLTLWAWFRHIPPAPIRLGASAGRSEGALMKWVTRERPKTDRIACPCLIRRFIDPDAEILYVPADQVLATATTHGGYSFDAEGATYTHRGRQCTFEVLIDDYQLGDDPELVRLARIVHAADVTGELNTDPLGAGLLAIGIGGLDLEADDHRLLDRGSFVYDALYAWCTRQLSDHVTHHVDRGVAPVGLEQG
jgi:hypothetical protein